MRRLDLLIEKLLDRALAWRMVPGEPGKQKPGQLIERLSEEERELLSQAKAEDFDHNPPTVKSYRPF